MIKSFGDDATREIFHGRMPKGLPAWIGPAARRKLRYLDAATRLDDLRSPPGNRLHPLLGKREGQYAIWINDQYRLCFRWQSDGVHAVTITDYH